MNITKCTLWKVNVPIGMGDFEYRYYNTKEKAMAAKEDWVKFNFNLLVEEVVGWVDEDGKYYLIKCVIE